MILHYKDINIEENKISFKKKVHFSKDFSFIPIIYDNKDFIIQTPKLFSPFEVQQYPNNNKKYLNLSFQDLKDKHTEQFIKNCLDILYKKTKEKYSNNYHIEKFIKENDYSKWMRFKLPEYCKFYDQNKKLIETFPSKVIGSFIIQLSGLWLLNNNIIFNWNIIQGQVTLPIKLKDFIIVDDDNKINMRSSLPPPPPPPLPPPPPPPLPPLKLNKYDKMLKIGIPKEAVKQKKTIDTTIKESDLKSIKLKKVSKDEKQSIVQDSYLPSLNEIRIALKSLKIVNL